MLCFVAHLPSDLRRYATLPDPAFSIATSFTPGHGIGMCPNSLALSAEEEVRVELIGGDRVALGCLCCPKISNVVSIQNWPLILTIPSLGTG